MSADLLGKALSKILCFKGERKSCQFAVFGGKKLCFLPCGGLFLY
jgi:hypothetical protein